MGDPGDLVPARSARRGPFRPLPGGSRQNGKPGGPHSRPTRGLFPDFRAFRPDWRKRANLPETVRKDGKKGPPRGSEFGFFRHFFQTFLSTFFIISTDIYVFGTFFEFSQIFEFFRKNAIFAKKLGKKWK